MRMLNAVSAIIVSLHIAACVFYLTARIDGFSPDTWVVRNNYIDNSTFTKYLAAVY